MASLVDASENRGLSWNRASFVRTAYEPIIDEIYAAGASERGKTHVPRREQSHAILFHVDQQ